MRKTESIAARFSSAAHSYDRSVDIQPIVAAKVAAMTKTLDPPSSILDWGCGTGNLSACLHSIRPDSSITGLDISEKMITRAQKENGKAVSEWIVDDIRSIKNSMNFDIIASSSSLHWIRPLSSAFKAAYRHLRTDGRLVFGMMIKGTLKELMDCRKTVAPEKPIKQPMPDKDDVVNALNLNGFSIVEEIVEKTTTEHTSTSQLLKSLHDQGVTGGHFTSTENLLNRSELKALEALYDSSYKTKSGGVYATYRVFYVIAEK